MKYRVVHVTNYDYSEPVSLCHNLAHLKLRHQPGQIDITSHISVDPFPSVIREFRDWFGNQVNYFAVQQSHRKLTITATSEVSLTLLSQPAEGIMDRPWETVNEYLTHSTNDHAIEARMFTLPSPNIRANQALLDYVFPSFSPCRPFLLAVTELMTRIYTDFTYDPNSTDIATPLEEVVKNRRGVCQDFAHVAIGCLRALGLPARYVSGYLETLPPPGKPKLRGADASHAWFSVFAPGLGWCDFDPTNNIRPVGQHITTAVGRDFGDVTPVKGVLYGGGMHKLHVSVDVERIA